MKKVLAAALLCTVSAFATWDYFPVKDAGKGEAKAGVGYAMQDKLSALAIGAGARFSVIEGLEVALMFSFPMSLSWDGDSCKDWPGMSADDCPPTMDQPTIGLRYWLPMGLGIGLDVDLPFQGDALGGSDGANLTFTPALQFSTKFTDELEFGSEISLAIGLENGEKDGKVTPPMELGIGLELDYSLGKVTPFVACDVAIELTKEKINGKDDFSDDTAVGITPTVGVIVEINEMLSFDLGASFGIGKDYFANEFTDKMPILIGANFSVNF